MKDKEKAKQPRAVVYLKWLVGAFKHLDLDELANLVTYIIMRGLADEYNAPDTVFNLMQEYEKRLSGKAEIIYDGIEPDILAILNKRAHAIDDAVNVNVRVNGTETITNNEKENATQRHSTHARCFNSTARTDAREEKRDLDCSINEPPADIYLPDTPENITLYDKRELIGVHTQNGRVRLVTPENYELYKDYFARYEK